MTVYVITQVTITNPEPYERYSSKFMDVFSQFDGEILSADFNPTVLMGDWKANRSVLMEFPSKKSALAWMTSDAYQEIAKDRDAGASLNSILVKGLE